MLFPISKILVCTDLSEASDQILKNAEVLRQRTNAELEILFVSDIDLQLNWASSRSKKETFYEAFVGNIARDLQEKMESQIKRTGITGKVIFEQGPVTETILKIASDISKNYDLLVVGHNSRKGLLGHLMGSTARKLVASSGVPLIIIKKDMSFDKIAGLIDDVKPSNWMITSTLDFYRSLSFKQIEFISLWHDFPEIFTGVSTISEAEKTFKEEVKYFTRDGEEPIIRFESTRDLQVADHLCRIIEEDGVNLAIMKKNRGKKLNKLIIGSETMRMLEAESSNLLILPV